MRVSGAHAATVGKFNGCPGEAPEQLATGDFRALELPELAVFEVPIGEIGRRTGLVLPASSGSEAAAGRKSAPKTEALETPRIRRVGSVREIMG